MSNKNNTSNFNNTSPASKGVQPVNAKPESPKKAAAPAYPVGDGERRSGRGLTSLNGSGGKFDPANP